VLEDGTRLGEVDRLPRRTPLGYHRLEPLDARRSPRSLIVAPARCPLPDRRRAGVAVQLYAARSRESWGIGDLGSAAALGRWACDHGADFLLLSPLHATAPTAAQQPSPYSPASRRFRTPLALHVADLPGAARHAAELEPLRRAAVALQADRLIDRDAAWRLIHSAAELCHAAEEADGPNPDLDAWVASQGDGLRHFALWCALAEIHGASWHGWPERLRRPGPTALQRLATQHAKRIRLHLWLQWQLDRQLADTSRHVDLVHDLAVACDPEGADTWIDQGAYAEGMRVGAPPDLFNVAGQDWGLPPFHPWRLRDLGYRPFIETIRAGFRHAAGLRIDHVMGLTRLWWVPPGLGPAAGGYIRYPSDDLLGIVALEAHRAGAFVVGEDLGTVDPAIRVDLRRRGILSYRLVMFEPSTPGRFPRQALAAATTHDLPTLAGLWSGADAAALAAMGRSPDADAVDAVRSRFLRIPGVSERSRPAALVDAVHSALGRSPALLAVATLDDLLLVEERPNHPGTVDEWPNWRLALPRTVEEITADPAVGRRLRRLRRR
jgi:4-alpha-glucanotransferase